MIPRELSRFGVTGAQVPKARRLVAVCAGLPGVGKSDLMLRTAPRPLLIINLDRNIESLEARYADDDGIIMKDVRMARVPNQAEDEVLWNEIRDLYETATSKNLVRSILIDTGDALHELLRRAKVGDQEFGSPTYSRSFGVLNSNMRWIFAQAKDCRVNMLMTHKFTDEYVEGLSRGGKRVSIRSGKLKMAGWKDAQYEAQLYFSLYKDMTEVGDDRYKLQIVKCNGNPEMEDQVLSGKEVTWGNLGVLACPWSSLEEWA